MHRLLTDEEQLTQDSPELSKEARNHLKVLRPKEGEEIELFDGRGHARVFAYFAAGLRAQSDVRFTPRPAVALTLFACVTKGSRWDWTIEKATELGVARIVPVISARTIVRIDPSERAAKRARWTRIAADAARQSDAMWLPEVLEPISFAESLALVRMTRCFVGALVSPPPEPIAAALRGDMTTTSDWSVYVGPEGDFTPEELKVLLEIATPVSFGTTILRAETAAIFGVSALKAHCDVFAR